MDTTLEIVLSVLVGVGLSAACGFRVFVPLLVISIASKTAHLSLAPGFEWMGSWPALVAFSLATALEITAYYVPWLDNLMDSIATPAAIVAGVIATAACIGDMSPFLKWTLAVIAGGGAAGAVQTVTVAARSVSTAATGGLANWVVATVENIGAAVMSALAILAPIAAITAIVATVALLGWRIIRRRAAASAPAQ
ncbi:MAG: DUF4126 domain-containing protein [Planctomycetota bacterium]|nr:DUF4126 domain-containing protein [Planctomycetota bacterium]